MDRIGRLRPAWLAGPLAAALALAACADEPATPEETDAPPEAALPEDPLAGDVVTPDAEREAEVLLLGGEPAPGAWSFEQDVAAGIGPRALYGEDEDSLVAVTCDRRAGQLVVARAGTISPGREVAMKIVTGEQTLALTGRSSIGDLPLIEARLDPESDSAAALAGLGDGFAVAVEATEPVLLAAPADQIARVVEACRSAT